MRTHTHKKGAFLRERLKAPDITHTENLCNGFSTFESHYYYYLVNEYYNLSNEKKDNLRPSNFDNILINYSTIWGKQIIYTPTGNEWSVTAHRIRYNENNRFTFFDDSKQKNVLSPKYRTAKGGANFPFLNGIYAYYIKPLLEKGFTKQEVIEQLKPTFQKIAITEGEFKAFIGCKNGFPTVAASGIHNAVKTIKKTVNKGTLKEYQITIDAEFLPELKDFIKLFEVEEILYLMDGDCFDNQDKPNRAKSFFGAIRNFWFAARNESIKMTFGYIKPDAGGKGLDDLILSVNSDRSKVKSSIEMIDLSRWERLEQLQYTFAESVLHYPFIDSNKREVIKLPEGEKLTAGLSIDQAFDKILIAPTGSGKTYLVNTCKDWIIIVCPTTALCQNVSDEYRAYYFNAKEQYDFDNDMENLSRRFIAVTYDSFQKLTGFLGANTNKFRVFIDESHNFTLAANYRLKALTGVVELSEKYRSVTLLTGTYIPCFHADIMKMPVIQVVQPRKEVKAELLECSDVLKGAQYLVQQSISSGRFPLILFNSKNTAGRLGTLKAYLKDLDFAFFNADTKKEKDWQLITSKGQIASKYKGVCVTSVLKEGNNIYNQYDFDIIIIGNFHSIEIEQFSRRPRLPKSLRIYKLVGQKRIEQEKTTGIYSLATNLLYKSIATCNELNTNDAIDFELMENEFFARQAIAALPIRLDENGLYLVDYLRLSNYAFQLDNIQENRNTKLLQKRIYSYGIILSDSKQLDIKKDSTEGQAAKVNRDSAQAIKEQQFDTLLTDLEHKEIFTLANNQLSYHSKALTTVEKQVYKQIKSLANLMGSKIPVLAAINECRLSDAKFTLLKRQYIINLLKSNDTYMASNRKFVIVLNAIYNYDEQKDKGFKVGQQLTASKIRLKLIEVLRIDKGLDISKLESGALDAMNKKAISILKLFFLLKIKRKKIKGKVISLYTLGCTKRDNILSNTIQFGATFEQKSLNLNKNGYPNFFNDLELSTKVVSPSATSIYKPTRQAQKTAIDDYMSTGDKTKIYQLKGKIKNK